MRSDGDVAIDGLRAAPRHSGGGPARTGGPGLSVELEPGAGAASEARAALTVLDGRIEADALDDVRLLVSELVTNSVRHSGGHPAARIRLDVTSRRGTVRVEVSDAGEGFVPRARTKGQSEAGGWGLHLVERIAARWAVETGRHTRVWFEIDS
jgi:anti-sigma regulatory factor (Ser/Thr protein kinase)